MPAPHMSKNAKKQLKQSPVSKVRKMFLLLLAIGMMMVLLVHATMLQTQNWQANANHFEIASIIPSVTIVSPTASADAAGSSATDAILRNPNLSSPMREPASNIPNSTKPILYLHVGPRKTGSTTLQDFMQNNKEALARDNIVVFHPYNHLRKHIQFSLCKAKKNETNNKKMRCQYRGEWKIIYDGMKRTGESAQHHNQSVFLSAETFARWPENDQAIRELQSLQELFDVKVIVIYRRYTEWYRSMYHQYRKTCMFDSRNGIMRDFNWTMGPLEPWLFPPPSIREFSPDSRDTLEVVEFYGRVFGPGNIYVGDLHAPSGLERNFFCEVFPGAFPTACDAAVNITKEKEERENKKEINSSGGFGYDEDLFVSKAYHRGYLQSTPTTEYVRRRGARLRVQRVWAEEGRDRLPEVCMEDNLFKSLSNRTLYMEQMLSSNRMSKEELRAYLESQKPKFCDIDADALLNQTRWQKLLSSCDFQLNETCQRTVLPRKLDEKLLCLPDCF